MAGVGKRADADLGNYLVVALTADKIHKYSEGRLASGSKPVAVNRTIQFVRQAFKLATQREQPTPVPYIRKLSEKDNERHGFCEEATFRAILGFLPSYLKDFCLFVYCIGMRFGEARSLKWANVQGDGIELEAPGAKAGEPRIIPMAGKDLEGFATTPRSAESEARRRHHDCRSAVSSQRKRNRGHPQSLEVRLP